MGRCTKRLGTKAAFASKPVCIQRKKEKYKNNSGMRIVGSAPFLAISIG